MQGIIVFVAVLIGVAVVYSLINKYWPHRSENENDD